MTDGMRELGLPRDPAEDIRVRNGFSWSKGPNVMQIGTWVLWVYFNATFFWLQVPYWEGVPRIVLIVVRGKFRIPRRRLQHAPALARATGLWHLRHFRAGVWVLCHRH